MNNSVYGKTQEYLSKLTNVELILDRRIYSPVNIRFLMRQIATKTFWVVLCFIWYTEEHTKSPTKNTHGKCRFSIARERATSVSEIV